MTPNTTSPVICSGFMVFLFVLALDVKKKQPIVHSNCGVVINLL